MLLSYNIPTSDIAQVNRVLVTLSNLLLPNVITFSASMYSHTTNTSNAAIYETKAHTFTESGLHL